MAWEFSYLKNHDCIHVRLTGPYISEHIDHFRMRLKTECEKWGTRKCLVDYRETDFRLPLHEINRTPDYLKKHGMISGFKYSMLTDPVSETRKKIQMLTAVFETKNYLFGYEINFRHFHDENEAFNWLDSE